LQAQEKGNTHGEVLLVEACDDCKQLGHISKVRKSKNKTSKQAQLAEVANTKEEQLFQSLAYQQMTHLVLS